MSCNCALSYCNDFSKTLHYVSPSHGGWGVIKVAALVPDSAQLFVAPMACGRHGALGGIEAGIKDRVHYLYLEEADIVSGGYENQIYEAVDELFKYIEKPKILFVFVACIDDMLGTDNAAIIRNLSKTYPDVIFKTCHMNPVSMDTATPPGVFLERTMYSLLEENYKSLYKGEKPFVQLVGNNDNLEPSCELYAKLAEKGYAVRHLSETKSFEDFKTLSGAKLNLVLRPVAKAAAMGMENKIKVPYLLSYVNYHPQQVCDFYKELADKLNCGEFDIGEDFQKAEEAIEHLKKVLNGRAVAIDYQAVLKPFSLARALLEHGITVSLIAVGELAGFEKQDRDWVMENHPEVHVVNAAHPENVLYKLRGMDVVCVGFDCGYMTMSKHTCMVLEDKGLFGFDGIIRLMKEIEKAATKETDLWQGIREAKLVI